MTHQDYMKKQAEEASYRPNIFAFARGDVKVSFEFFPPKTDAMEETF